MIQARKKHGGASCYLVSPDIVQAFIRYETWAQGVANCFCNITVNPIKAGNIISLLFGCALVERRGKRVFNSFVASAAGANPD